jgi:hypothetical protein
MPNLLVNAVATWNGKALQKGQKQISGFDKTVQQLGKTFAGVFTAQKILAYGKASIQAFAADDKAAKVLSRTLSNLGLAFADPAVKTFISDLEKQFGVLDDYLRPAYQKLITTTGDYRKSQDLLKTALDLSAQSGSDVVSVSNDIARAYAGNTKGLQKYGLGLTKAQLSAMSFEQILERITKISKGQAAIAADTYAGKLDKLNVAAANASETIGGALVDAFVSIAGDGNIDKAIDKIDLLAESIATLISPSRMEALFAGVDLRFGLIPVNKTPNTNRSKSPAGTYMRNAAEIAAANKLKKARAEELALLAAKNKATKEEAQMKKDQAALDKLKEKFDLERIGLNVALNQATDEETKARIRAQIAILDETGKTAQAANDALVKAQADKLKQELEAANALKYLADSAGLASIALMKYGTGIPGVTFNPNQRKDRNYDDNFLTNIPPVMPDGTPALIPGVDYNPEQRKDANVDAKAAISVVVNTGPSMADENVIVDAVQNALNEIARRGYLTTYAGALPA